MSDLAKNILDTISMMTQHAVNSAQFDRTIQAIIVSCEDQANGIYKVKYQDSIWVAYSANLNNKYSAGTSVYVLVPGNNMSRNKTIIGTVSTLGQDYVDFVRQSENYIEIGNSITSITNNGEYGLCSYKTQQLSLLSDSIHNFQLDDFAASTYLTKSEYMIVKADFRTDLPEEQRHAGDYGIIVTLEFKNQQNPSVPIVIPYILNIDTMVGNPYMFKTKMTQVAYFKIDGANFNRIRDIEIFDRSFQHQEFFLKPNDIFISNIEIIGANTLTQEERQGLSLRFKSPRGYIFTSNELDTDTKSIIAQIRVSNRLLSSDREVQFYWFKQDARVDTGNSGYSKYGGKGWYCLNNINTEDTTGIGFFPGTSNFVISKGEAITSKIKFKCVAIYKGNEISNTFQILNRDAEYQVKIVSENENKDLIFYSNTDILTLVCNAKRNGTIISQGVVYYWKVLTEGGIYSTLGGVQNQIQVSAQNVITYSDYFCSAYINNVLIGTDQVRIFKQSPQGDRYVLVINNGVQLFNYDEHGKSPCSRYAEVPLVLKQLTYSLVDTQTGLDVADQAQSIIWTIPLVNTMLIDKNQVGDNIFDDDEEESENETQRTYDNLQNFVYGISDEYNIRYSNNTIKLQARIHGNDIIATTNFTFTKEGEPGTNGTGITCKIVAEYNNQRLSGWLFMRMYYSSGTNFNWDNLKVQLWQDGEVLFSGRTIEDANGNTRIKKVEWSILSNSDNSWFGIKQDLTNEKSTVLKVNSFPFDINTMDFDNTLGYNAGILKVTIQYEEQQNIIRNYYAFQPIATIFSEKSGPPPYGRLDTSSGFKYVVYSQDGQNPLYDNTNPFKIILEDESDEENVTWETKASRRISSTTFKDSTAPSLKVDTFKSEDLPNTQRFIKPSTVYDGISVTNCIIVKGTKFWIHIPILLMYNRYGHKQINDWDGASIKIDKQNNYILSPQIGAGIKNDTDNTFTGLLMGRVHNYDANEDKIGLLGYKDGVRTIFLDSETGRAEFGREGAGQIIIDPSSVDHALIKGGNYNTTARTGMQIDLTAPQIKFGNENFIVNENSLSLGQGRLVYNATEGTLTLNVDNISIGSQDGSKGCLFYNADSEAGPVGLYISSTKITSASNRTGGNVRLSSNGLQIYRGKEQLASYGSTTYFYSWSGTGASRTRTQAAILNSNGLTIKKGIISLGTLDNTTGVPTTGSGLYVDSSGRLFLGKKENYLRWDGNTLTLQGNYNQTGGSISLGNLSSAPGVRPTTRTTGSGFKVNSAGSFTVGNANNYLCWTGSSLLTKLDSFVCQSSSKDEVEISNGLLYITYNGDKIGRVGGLSIVTKYDIFSGDPQIRRFGMSIFAYSNDDYVAIGTNAQIDVLYTPTAFNLVNTDNTVKMAYKKGLNITCATYFHNEDVYEAVLYKTKIKSVYYTDATTHITTTYNTIARKKVSLSNGSVLYFANGLLVSGDW